MINKISVFGGSKPQKGTNAYQDAYKLGELLGGAGLTVLTGGYMGTMEAVSHGASTAGGHVIGVTSEQMEEWRPIGPNPWVKEEWRCETFRERLISLVENCDAAVALPGGVGTLLEICLTWNQIVVDAIQPKPLVLVGSEWHHILDTFFKELGDYVPIESREFIAFAPTPDKAFELLAQFLGLS